MLLMSSSQQTTNQLPFFANIVSSGLKYNVFFDVPPSITKIIEIEKRLVIVSEMFWLHKTAIQEYLFKSYQHQHSTAVFSTTTRTATAQPTTTTTTLFYWHPLL